MRLICIILEDKFKGEQLQQYAYEFSHLLTSNGIANECEEVASSNGAFQFRIWVFDEDQVDNANQLYEQFLAHPEKIQPKAPSLLQDVSFLAPNEALGESQEAPVAIIKPPPFGKVTLLILAAAILIFIWSIYQRPITPAHLAGIPDGPNLAPIEKALIYDYPLFFELRDQLLKVYTPAEIQEGTPPSDKAKSILQKMGQTTYWAGFYDYVVSHLKNKPNFVNTGPLFEKIRKGEVWRLFTPALLHFDILHIFFNALWFILLGNQIENRIGSLRYLLLILLGAIITNSSQYLMSGPFFLGLSGVVTTLAGFIWARQMKAPWEGYLISRMTLAFLFLFIVGMFILQVVLFILQLYGTITLPFNIANTAHLAGLVLGFLLGQMKAFGIKHKT